MTDTYSPTGPAGIAMQKLRHMVSKSATFQTRTGLSESQLYNVGFYTDVEETQGRPMFVIRTNDIEGNTLAGGGQNFMRPAGVLFLLVEVDATGSYTTDNDKRLEAVDLFGNIKADLEALSAADDPGQASSHLAINRIDAPEIGCEPPNITQPSTGRFFWAIYTVDWGNRQ